MTTHQNHRTGRKHHTGGSFSKMFEDLMNSSLSEVIDSAFVATKPFVNVHEHDAAFEMHVAAPGLNKSDFKIEVRNGMLHISADQSGSDDAEIKTKEFDFGQFTRTFRLSDKVDADHISARYENGILIVSLPKRVKESWHKEIKVD
jgi:HSP20 family protein